MLFQTWLKSWKSRWMSSPRRTVRLTQRDCRRSAAAQFSRLAPLQRTEILEERSLLTIGTPVILGEAGNKMTNTSITLGGVSTPLASTINRGDTVILTFALDANAGAVSVSDSKNNTYVLDFDAQEGSGTNGVRTLVFSARITELANELATTDTITVTYPSTEAKAVSAIKVAGLVTSVDGVDQTAFATGSLNGTTVQPNSGNVTTTQADEVLIGLVGTEFKQVAFGSNATAGAGFTSFTGDFANSGDSGQNADNISILGQYRVVSAIGTYNSPLNIGISSQQVDWCAGLVTFRAAAVSVSVAPASVNEDSGNGLVYTFSRNGITTSSETVHFTVNGTATSGTDYPAIGVSSVTIGANQASASITVTPTSDAFAEANETVVLTITPNAAYLIGTPSATGTILNDDIGVSIAKITDLAEPATNGKFRLTLTQALGIDTVVSYTVGGTATSGTDFTALSGTATILANTTTVDINVSTLDDVAVEGTETVVVTLTGTNNVVTVTMGSSVATANITDNDATTVSITANDASASEAGSNPGQFTVSLSGGVVAPTGGLTVNFVLTGSTATSGSDYSSIGTSVVIPAGASSVVIDVTGVVDDAIVEANETVVVTLSSTGIPSHVTVNSTPATVTISDDDMSSLTINDVTLSEGTGAGTTSFTFTVTLSAAVQGGLTVAYTTNNGTATTADSDYTDNDGSLNFAGTAGETKTITVLVAQDSKVESDETFTVLLGALSNLNAGVDSADISVQSTGGDGVITNDDLATVSIAANDASAFEPSDNGQFTVSLNTTSASATTISYTVTGTATSGSDYSALSGSVTIAANSTSATIDVTLLADTLLEGDETVIVTLGSITSGDSAIIIASSPDNTATVTISDTTDTATVSVTASDATASEPGDNGQFAVSLSALSSTATTVSYTVTGSATAGSDYSTLTGSVTIAANTLSATIDVSLLADSLVEGDETVIVTLGSVTSGDPQISIASSPNNTATVTISDTEDTATLSITANDATASEPSNNGQFTVSLSALSSTATTVSYTVTGSATAGSDYSTLSGSVTIAANTASATIDVSLLADTLVEGDETVILTLGSVTSGDSQISIASSPNNTATVTISDTEDTATVSVTANDATASEPSNNGQFTVSLGALSSTATTVSYTVTGTATAGSDYSTLSGSVTIAANTTSATIDVSLLVDSLIEGDETVIVTLGSVTSGDSQISIASSPNNTATVTISDTEDTATVSVTANDATAAEPSNNGQFTVSLSALSSTATTVSYTVTGSATAGSDYSTLSGSVTIAANTLSTTIDVSLLADTLVEGDETVIVTLGSVMSGDPQISIASSPNNTATVTISDTEDTATVSITANDSTAAEPSNNGQFTVSLSALSSTATTVSYTVTGSATAGSDYSTLTGSVTIAANTASATIDVSLLADTLVEGDETVIVTLGSVTSGDSQISIASSPNNTATVTISDTEDTATVSITANDATAAEPSNNGQFTVSLSALSSTATTVSYTVTGSATAGSDYSTLSGSVTIAANTSSATIDVSLLADTLIEGDETVIVTLGSVTSSDPQISLASSPNNTATVTISDTEDTATVSVTANDATAAEPSNNGQFTVNLSALSSTATTVSYTVTGSATAGSDYSTLSGSVTIAANASSATIDVSLLADALVEGNETVIVTLGSVTSGDPQISIASSPNNTATVTISDTEDTATVSITANDSTAAEPSNNGQFTVSLSALSSTATTVSYTVTGSATGGSDYSTLSGSVTIAANASSATIDVSTLQDVLLEGSETVIVTLGSVTSGDPQISIASSPNNAATVMIGDDESATLSIATPVTVTEGGGAQNVGVTLTITGAGSGTFALGSGITLTASVTQTGGTATSGDDYTAFGTQTVTFNLGATTGTVRNTSLAVLEDPVYEGSETVLLTLGSLNAGGTATSLGTTANTTTITDNDVPPPVDTDAAANTAVEGAASGTAVGITASSFVPGGPAVTYSLTNSAGGRFAIDANTGVVTVANSSLLNFETASSHSITVQASDGIGGTASTSFSISVTNVNPTTPTDGNGAANSVAEGAANGTTVGITASSTDPNGPAVAYSLTNDAGGRFAINSSSGVVTVANGSLLDGAATHSITVQASDGAGGTSSASFNINVSNVAPTIALTGDASVDEETPYTLNLGALTDPGADTVTSYSINWGDGTAVENFAGSPVGLAKQHTYADGGSFTITVSVTDEDGTFVAGTFALSVNFVVPTMVLTGNTTTNEGASYTLNLGTITNPGTVSGYSIDWGDGITENFSGNPQNTSKTHIYTDGLPIARTISVSLTNERGTFLAVGTLNVTVLNVAPTLAPTLGELYSVTYTGADLHSLITTTPALAPSGTRVLTGSRLDFTNTLTTGILLDLPLIPAGQLASGNTVIFTITADWDNLTADADLGWLISDGTTAVGGNLGQTNAINSFFWLEQGTDAGTVVSPVSYPNVANLAGNKPFTTTVTVTPTGSVTVRGTNSLGGTFLYTTQVTATLNISNALSLLMVGDTANESYGLKTLSLTAVGSGVFTNNGPISEGGAGSVYFTAEPFDPSSEDTAAPLKYSYDFGNDGIWDIGNGTWAGGVTASSVAIPASFNDGTTSLVVRGRVMDKDFAVDGDTSDNLSDYFTTVVITNVAPTIALSGASAVAPGVPYSLNLGAITDPGQDTVTSYSINWGDGTAVENFSGSPVGLTKMHTFTSEATRTITVSLTDEDGTFTGGTKIITVSGTINIAPVAVDDAANTNEDTALTLTQADLKGNDTDVDNTNAQLSVTAVSSATNGSVVLNGNGTITFTPTANFSGTAGFDYTLSDGSLTDTGHVTITVNAVNDAPVAVDDTASANEDTALTLTQADLKGNDTDVDNTNAQLSVTAVSSATNGSVVLNGNGTITFTPTANFSGTAGFDYTLSDGSLTDTGHVTITVNAVNDAPVAVDDTASTNEDTALTLTQADLKGNDTDVDNTNAQLSVTAVSSATNGTVVLNGDGTVTFTPTANFSGTAGFDYTVSDGGLTDTGHVTITVNEVNDAPVAVDDSASTNEDTVLTLTQADLKGNDTDVDNTNAQLSVAAVSGATNGTAVLNGDGTVTFTPTANFSGTAGFDYTLSDGSLTDMGHVTITVNAVNDAPVAVDDTAITDEDTALTLTQADLKGNDTDVDNTNAQLSVTAVSSATNGTVVLNGDGTVTFTPALDFSGTAGFDYTLSDGSLTDTGHVTVLVNSTVNDAPVAVDDTASTNEDAPLTLTQTDLKGNDTDVDNTNAELSVTAVSGATNGSVVLNGNGTITFTPATDFFGTAGFDYTLSDGSLTDTGHVTITVNAVNDAPTAVDDSLSSVAEDSGTRVISFASLTANDSAGPANESGQSLTITAVSNAIGGTVTINGTNVEFTPTLNFNGTASFDYTLSDGGLTDTGSVSFTITAVNDAPVAVDDSLSSIAEDSGTRVISFASLTGNDSAGPADESGQSLTITAVFNAVGGTVTINGTNVEFTPTANFNGAASFDYTLSDGSLTDTGSVSFTITAVNDAPVAVDDSLSSIAEDSGTRVISFASLTGNDSAGPANESGQSLTITAVSNAVGGTLTINGTNVEFTPTANFNGTASFDYTLSDGSLTDIGSVSFTISAVNDAPVAVDDTATTNQDTGLTLTQADLKGNDTDVDNTNAQLSVTAVSNATNGSVVLNGNGTITFTPSAGFSGTAGFDYTLSDGSLTDTGHVTVTVNAAPTIVLTGNATTNEGAVYTLNLGAVTNPGTISGYSINWGDGVTENFSGSPASTSRTHTYADGSAAGTARTIVVSITNENGTFSAGTKSVTVNNVAPTIALTGSGTATVGVAYSLNLGTITDPGTDTVTSYSINWGDGTAVENFAGSPVGLTKTHTYASAATRTITVSLTDEDGTFTGGTTSVTVNAAPAPTFNLGPTTYTGTQLNALVTAGGATYPSGTHTLTGSRLDLTSTLLEGIVYRMPLVPAGTLNASSSVTFTTTVDWAALTNDNDFGIGISDGTKIVAGQETDAGKFFLEQGNDSGTQVTGVAYPNNASLARTMPFTVTITVTPNGIKVRGTNAAGVTFQHSSTSTLNLANALSLVLLGNTVGERYGVNTLTVQVATAGAVLSGGELLVTGTGANDEVLVRKSGDGTQVLVDTHFNIITGSSATTTSFPIASVTSVRMLLGSGDDKGFVRNNGSPWAMPSNISGEDGNDLVVTADGNDTISGGRGKDFLIAGAGTDSINGGAGEDLLISGSTSHDNNTTALTALMAEWTSNGSYSQRLTRLQNGTGATAGNKLIGNDGATQTVFADATADTLMGGADTDAFWANLVLDNGGALDLITDLVAGESTFDTDL